MRAAARFGLVVLLCAAATGLVPAPAFADSATPPAVKTNWYWSLVVPDAGGNKLPVGAPSQTSGVPDGDLGVGYTVDQAGTYDKVAAVAFDLSSVPAGSTFSSFVVSAAYDPAATQLANGTPDVSACELLDTFADSPGPNDLAKAPPISLPSCVKGTFVASIGTAGGYQFDLTAVANDWSGGAPAQGIMLRPTAGLATPQPPFTLSFLGKTGITTRADYTVPAPTTVPPVTAPGPVIAPPPPLPAVGPPPVLPGVVVPAPVVPAPAPQVNPAPRPAVAAASYTPGALVPAGAWWLALLGLLALLGVTAAILGDPLAPVVVDARRRRFAEVVRSQARTAAPATGRAARPSHRFRPA